MSSKRKLDPHPWLLAFRHNERIPHQTRPRSILPRRPGKLQRRLLAGCAVRPCDAPSVYALLAVFLQLHPCWGRLPQGTYWYMLGIFSKQYVSSLTRVAPAAASTSTHSSVA